MIAREDLYSAKLLDELHRVEHSPAYRTRYPMHGIMGTTVVSFMFLIWLVLVPATVKMLWRMWPKEIWQGIGMALVLHAGVGSVALLLFLIRRAWIRALRIYQAQCVYCGHALAGNSVCKVCRRDNKA